jgi:hypothetical protein
MKQKHWIKMMMEKQIFIIYVWFNGNSSHITFLLPSIFILFSYEFHAQFVFKQT